jgi:hypothetical protein
MCADRAGGFVRTVENKMEHLILIGTILLSVVIGSRILRIRTKSGTTYQIDDQGRMTGGPYSDSVAIGASDSKDGPTDKGNVTIGRRLRFLRRGHDQEGLTSEVEEIE